MLVPSICGFRWPSRRRVAPSPFRMGFIGAFRKQRETETGRPFVRNDVGRALRKRRSRSRSTLAPEILFIGWRLRAVLMTILCDHYLSCKAPPAGAFGKACELVLGCPTLT